MIPCTDIYIIDIKQKFTTTLAELIGLKTPTLAFHYVDNSGNWIHFQNHLTTQKILNLVYTAR
jgi:hypothetical protein